MRIEGRYVGVLGYARTGRALESLVLKVGGKVFVSDIKSHEVDEKGDNTYRILNTDLISPSPGIPPHNRVLRRAEASRIPILSEFEIGWNYIKGKVIAVTGTNGKSTVVHFTHTLLPESFVGGNWGVPVSSLAFKEGTFILEVSSFQLHYTRNFRPDVAVITNVSPDHIDWHGSFESYIKDKLRILINQRKGDIAVLNADDAHFYLFKSSSRGEVIRVSTKDKKADYYSDGKRVFTPYGRVDIPHNLRTLANVYNLLMAIAAATAANGDPNSVFERVIHLKPLPHRIELVGEVDGVRFYDDSKGTNPGATEAALMSFPDKVVLIMGGDDKGLDLSILEDIVKKKVGAIVAVGKNRWKIKEIFSSVVQTLVADDYREAVRLAYDEAKRMGLPVLLSPACASFDMFKNYEHRSEVFKREVESLQRNHIQKEAMEKGLTRKLRMEG